MNKPQKRVRLNRQSKLFAPRILIVVPTWGVFVLAAAIALPIAYNVMFLTNVTAIVVTFAALVMIFIERREVIGLRASVHKILNDIAMYDDPYEEADYVAFRENVDRIPLKKAQ